MEGWRRSIRRHPAAEGASTREIPGIPLPQVKADGGKHQQNNFLLRGHGLGDQVFLLHISPMNYLNGRCMCDTACVQAVNLIPL